MFADAKRLSVGSAEDQYEAAGCRVTCRYRVEPGDFVSKQVLGCHDAIRTGLLACADTESAMSRVAETQTVIGIAGPDAAVENVASALASRFSGVVVGPHDAVVGG